MKNTVIQKSNENLEEFLNKVKSSLLVRNIDHKVVYLHNGTEVTVRQTSNIEDLLTIIKLIEKLG